MACLLGLHIGEGQSIHHGLNPNSDTLLSTLAAFLLDEARINSFIKWDGLLAGLAHRGGSTDSSRSPSFPDPPRSQGFDLAQQDRACQAGDRRKSANQIVRGRVLSWAFQPRNPLLWAQLMGSPV
eukprot:1161859-Pelagomonas_calceolata.AAC.2